MADPGAPTLAHVLTVLDGWYPPHRADSWDAVGLVCGDPAQPVRRILLAVDPVLAVADEAVAWGADLLLVHHPLFLKGTQAVAASTPKGAVVHRLLGAGCALFTAHTNADVVSPGVSDALADALGVSVEEVLAPLAGASGLEKWIVYVPAEHAEPGARM